MTIDGALVCLGVGAACGVEQLGAGEHPAGMAGQGGEDLELGRREVDRLVGPAHAQAGNVEDEIRHAQEVAVDVPPLGPPQHGADARHELARAERFGHIVVGTDLQPLQPVVFFDPGSEHDPGGAWRFVMQGPDGTDYPNEIVFREIAAPERVVLEHLGGMHHFFLTITFTAQGEQTLVGWRQVFDTAEHRDEIAHLVFEANEQNLSRLAAEVREVV